MRLFFQFVFIVTLSQFLLETKDFVSIGDFLGFLEVYDLGDHEKFSEFFSEVLVFERFC